MENTTTIIAAKYHIRWMVRRDMPEVLQIDSNCYTPWGEEEILAHLRSRNVIGMVAEQDDFVVGFMIYELNKSHLEIKRLCTGNSCQKNNIGLAMIKKLKEKLSSHRRTSLHFVAPDFALPLHLFLKSSGFVAKGVYKNHFDDDDGYFFKYEL